MSFESHNGMFKNQGVFGVYYNGRLQARINVIKQIYTKYYRRKFAAGTFKCSWIPDAEKFKRIHDGAFAPAKSDENKCQLITINPGVKLGAEDPLLVLPFLYDVLDRILGYHNFLSPTGEYCLEHRSDDRSIAGIHLHMWHDNINGVARSDMARRIFAACKQVLKASKYADILVSLQSIDVKLRPLSSCQSYIRKNKDTDTVWGFGFQGDLRGNLVLHRENVQVAILDRCAQLRLTRESVVSADTSVDYRDLEDRGLLCQLYCSEELSNEEEASVSCEQTSEKENDVN